MKIIRDYILKEFLSTFAMLILLFTFVLVMGNIIKMADLIINRGVDILSALKLLLYLSPYLLTFSMPMAVLTSTLLVFGRLSSDNEIMAMQTSGIGLKDIFLPVVTIGLVFSVLSVPLNNSILPHSHFAARKVLKDILIKRPAAYLDAGAIVRDFKGYIILVHEVDKNVLKNIRIYQPQKSRPTRSIVASRGEVISIEGRNAIRIKLSNGTSDEPDPSNPMHFYKMNFKTYYITLDLQKMEENADFAKKFKEMSFSELKDEMKKLKSEGIDISSAIAEMHKKTAISFSSLAFILIALPLAVTVRRGERSIGFGISLVLIVFYWLMLAGGEAVASMGIFTPWICMWLPNIIVGGLGITLIIIKSIKT